MDVASLNILRGRATLTPARSETARLKGKVGPLLSELISAHTVQKEANFYRLRLADSTTGVECIRGLFASLRDSTTYGISPSLC